MEILGPGSVIDCPEIDVRIWVLDALKGIYGSEKWVTQFEKKAVENVVMKPSRLRKRAA